LRRHINSVGLSRVVEWLWGLVCVYRMLILRINALTHQSIDKFYSR